MLFSIIVVCLNAGDKLRKTLESIEKQTYKNYEVIIKDGCSKDGSLEAVKDFKDIPVSLYCMKDTGIYDAMNQGLKLAKGEYVYYLNCGDYFASPYVLELISKHIERNVADIYYGNIFERITQTVVSSNPVINEFACFRNVPCHQACFYKKEIIDRHPFDVRYKVRADYEQFLWCFFKQNARFSFIDLIIADYEGGGFSEDKTGQLISKQEHNVIVKEYIATSKLIKYRAIMAITFAPLRTAISKNPKTAGMYNKVKNLVYKK